jgi:hypothetical protein
MIILSSLISKFSIEVLDKKENRTTTPWYDKECKIARKTIRDASKKSQKSNKINRYCCHLYTHLDNVEENFNPLGVSLGESFESRCCHLIVNSSV